MHIEFLVEEESAERALKNLVPLIFSGTEPIDFDIHAFQGKKNLLDNLPKRLRGYSSWLPEDWRIVILIDEDRQDCRQLKQELERVALLPGFVTKSTAQGNSFQVLNRIAIEELEAWFLGDVDAIVQAYPKVSPTLAKQEKFRDPDAINGGTWEVLERVLQEKGYHPGGLEKIKVAEDISKFMTPEVNRSRSFQVFRDGLLEIIK